MNIRLDAQGFCAPGRGAVAAGAAAKSTILEPTVLSQRRRRASGRKIRFVSIGTGIRGCDLLRSARKVPTGGVLWARRICMTCIGRRAWRPTEPMFRQRGTIVRCSIARMWMR